MNGVVSGADYFGSSPPAAKYAAAVLPPAAPGDGGTDIMDVIAALKAGDDSLEEGRNRAGMEGWVSPDAAETTAFVSYGGISGTRVAKPTRDGVPQDYGRSSLRLVFDASEGGKPGTGHEILAEEYRRRVLASQQPAQPVVQEHNDMQPPAAPPPSSTDQLLRELLVRLPQAAVPPVQPVQVTAAAPAPAQQLPAATDTTAVTTAECGLGFLTRVPSRPEQRVTFDLGVGGTHRKRYHAITATPNCLSLVSDVRYDGDEFVPPTKQGIADGDDVFVFGVYVESLDREFRCSACDGLNIRIGDLSIINLLIHG
jgi:hypothetical protein